MSSFRFARRFLSHEAVLPESPPDCLKNSFSSAAPSFARGALVSITRPSRKAGRIVHPPESASSAESAAKTSRESNRICIARHRITRAIARASSCHGPHSHGTCSISSWHLITSFQILLNPFYSIFVSCGYPHSSFSRRSIRSAVWELIMCSIWQASSAATSASTPRIL